MKTHIKLWLTAGTLVSLLAVDSAVWAFSRPRWTPRCYQRGTAATAPVQQGDVTTRPGVQSTRRYSYTPGTSGFANGYSNSPPMNSGNGGSYRPGRGYTPSRGINRADFKIRGL